MEHGKGLGAKLWLGLLLAGAALVLGGVLLVRTNDSEHRSPLADRTLSPTELQSIVDSLARVFSIPEDAVRQRREYVGRRLQGMPEYRIDVPRDFSTLAFNRELSRSVAPYGAVVSGEERPREKKITLRVLRDDKQMWTIVFSLTKTSGGKESNNRR
jgi:hypothetical protein